MLPLSERKKIIAQVPWIKVIPPDVRCDAIRWGEVPLKAIYAWGPKQVNPPTGTSRYRCTRQAHYALQAHERSDISKDGNYCWQHLMHYLLVDPWEDERFEKWYTDYRRRTEQDDSRDS